MAEYVLDHALKGEGQRLALMSELLDAMHRRHIESLGVVKRERARWRSGVVTPRFRHGLRNVCVPGEK